MVKYCQVLLVVAVMMVVVVASEEGARRERSRNRAKDNKPESGTFMWSSGMQRCLRKNIEKLRAEFKNKNWTAPVKGPINNIKRRIDKHLKNAEKKEKGQMLVVLIETLLHHLTPKADDATTTQPSVQKTTTTGTTTGTSMDKWQAFQPDDEEALLICSLQNKAKSLTQLLNNTSNDHITEYNRKCGDVFRTMRRRDVTDVCRYGDYVDCRRFVISRVTSLRTPLEALKNGTKASKSATDTLASGLRSMLNALDDLLGKLGRQCTAKTQKDCTPDKSKTPPEVKECVTYIQNNTGNGDLKTEVVFGFSKHMESFAKQLSQKNCRK